ncbi:MAG: DNA cytosine methyltransferase [Deltaproteobacteria bacterium]|nr:DNA cytosine methyltransferase [Deltaproteobacteria bacterium]
MKYTEELNEAWSASIRPRGKNAPTVVSTFAGCGGSGLGYRMAGFRELAAVEWDADACDTLRLNFDDMVVCEDDITNIDAKKLLRRIGLAKGELTVLDGSPPCQGFSTSGKRKIGDERNTLFKEFCRLLIGVKPQTFVMENVVGMVKGRMRIVFAAIMTELKRCGYHVRCRIMNAANYGVPQTRQRLIFVGTRKGLRLDFEFPRPFGKVVTAAEAFTGLPEDTRKGITSNAIMSTWIRCKLGKGFDSVHPDGHWFSCRKLDPMKPSPTIQRLPGKGGARTTGIFHWEHPRYINFREATRLMGFPDQFGWADSSLLSTGKQLGNAVPPFMIRTVASAIHETLDRPRKKIKRRKV